MIKAYEIAKTQLNVAEPSRKISEYHEYTYNNKKHDYHTAWCSSFVNWCMEKAYGEGAGTNSAWARSWASWGNKLLKPYEGCIVVFSRGKDPKYGHVGFFVKYSLCGTFVKVLGGNQDNKVCYKYYPRWRVIGYREAA